MNNFNIKKIFGKIFLKLILSIVLILIIFFIQMTIIQNNGIEDRLHSNAKTIADSIKYTSIESFIIDDEVKILEFVFNFVQDNKKVKKIIVSRKGGTKLILKEDSWLMKNDLDKKYDRFLLKNEDYYEIIKDKEEVFRYSYPIDLAGAIWGWFIIDLSLDEYNKMVNNMYKQFIFYAVIMFLLSLLMSYLIAKTLSNPIVKLNSVTKKIFSGDLSVRSDIKSDDEIGELSNSFNEMINSLEISQKELRSSHIELEKRVEERTSELKIVNKELTAKSKELIELNENLEQRVVYEVKKQKEQEQLLIQQSKLASMGEMIGNIAHQWRQPLNALGLVMQNIKFAYDTNTLDNDLMERSVEKANLLTKNMSKTIDDFRNFFKPNKEKEKFNLNDCMKESLKLIDSSYAHHNIKIIFNNFSENIFLVGFPNELSQVFLNILSNSKDAIIEKKVSNSFVKISIEDSKNNVMISIEDNAGGIPEQIIENIFEPYFTTKDEGKGTGIGLYMSKTIVETNMNGKLEVFNTNDGARFVITVKRV